MRVQGILHSPKSNLILTFPVALRTSGRTDKHTAGTASDAAVAALGLPAGVAEEYKARIQAARGSSQLRSLPGAGGDDCRDAAAAQKEEATGQTAVRTTGQ